MYPYSLMPDHLDLCRNQKNKLKLTQNKIQIQPN